MAKNNYKSGISADYIISENNHVMNEFKPHFIENFIIYLAPAALICICSGRRSSDRGSEPLFVPCVKAQATSILQRLELLTAVIGQYSPVGRVAALCARARLDACPEQGRQTANNQYF